jgi:hypothetical protein
MAFRYIWTHFDVSSHPVLTANQQDIDFKDVLLDRVPGPRVPVPGSQGRRNLRLANAMATPKIYWYPLKPMIYDIYDIYDIL